LAKERERERAMHFSVNSPESGGAPSDLDLEAFSPSKGNVPLDSSIRFICDALRTVGIDLSPKTPMDPGVCDALYTLLQQNQESHRYRQKLQNEIEESRQVINLERKQAQMARNEVNARDKQLRALENKTTLSDETVKDQLDRSKKLATDLNKRLMAAQKKIEIKEHQMKQKEVEYEKLQVVLRRYMEDKQSRHRKADQLISGKVSGGFAGAGAGAGASMASPRQLRQDDSVHGIIAVYESKQAELDKDNRHLKSQLEVLQKKYVDVMNRLEGRDKAAATSAATVAPGVATSIVDADFIDSIPTMGAGQLSAEIASRVKVLQSRVAKLEWHAHRFEAADGPPSIREKQLVEDLEAARSVLHDQGLMLTNVLTALRKAIVKEKQLYEAKMNEADRRLKEEVDESRRKLAQDKQTLDEENQAQVFCLKQEYEREVAYHKEEIAKLEGTVAAMTDKIEHMKSSHQVKLEEGLSKARAEFDAKADDIRAGADATIESMAAESSRIQLDYKKTHTALREEAEMLRKELETAQRGEREMEGKMKSALREAEERMLVEVEGKRAALSAEIEAEVGARLRSKFDADLKSELKAGLLAQERRDAEKLDQLEASFSAKIDMLLEEKQDGDAHAEGMSAELDIIKEQLVDARRDLERAERRLAEHRDGDGEHRADVSKALERAESQHQREKQSLLDMIESLEDGLRAAKRDISERDDVVRQSRLKEREATLTISKYDEMTEKYADMMRTYIPGLGGGGFLERGIGRRAQGLVL